MINICDVGVLIIIGGFTLLGIKKGFVMSLLRLVSFFLSYFGSIIFYPKLAHILYNTSLYIKIKSTILENLMSKQHGALQSSIGSQQNDTTSAILNDLEIPEFLKKNLLGKVSNLVDPSAITDAISGYLTNIIIDAISIVIMFIMIKLLLMVVRIVLRRVTRLPVIKQADRLGGLAFGIIEGIVTTIVIVQILILFSSLPVFEKVVDLVDTSLIAKYFKFEFITSHII